MSIEATHELSTGYLEIPESVKVELQGSILKASGPKGSVSKDFSKIKVTMSLKDGRVEFTPLSKKRRDRAVVNTAKSIVNNMIVGVTTEFLYRLKVVFAHFPASVKVKGGEVLIENFIGERSPRIAKIIGDCKVTTEGDDVVVRGVSKEDVGQTAANIERATRILRKDQRVFLDGVYVYEKGVANKAS